MLYTNLPSKNYGKYVKHINEFFVIYGKNGEYAGTHHVGIEAIQALNNQALTERAHRAITKGVLMKKDGRRPNTQAELDYVMSKINEAKAKSLLTGTRTVL